MNVIGRFRVSFHMRTFSTGRAVFVMLLLCSAFAALGGRVAYLQTLGREATIRKADRQQHQTMTLQSRRGDIIDCNGSLMAGTIQTQTLYADPAFMTEAFQEDGKSLVDMDDAVAKLAKILEKNAGDLSQLLSDRGSSRFIKLAENLDEPTCNAIQKLDIPGVGLIATSNRTYPMGSLAAHILGGTGKDGHGLDGLEEKFDKQLAGKDGWVRVLKDARRRPIGTAADDYQPAEHGGHLVLTIDANIQMICEQELAHACETNQAKRGEVVAMDPKTGDVLALANWPTFNPQNLDDSSNDTRRDRALTDPYELGSTAKPFMAGPAMAWGVTRADEVFPIHGPHYRTPYGRSITDIHGYDQLAMWDVLVKSSNIGMSMLGERLGNPRLHQALASFQFGQATGIELPAENSGRLNALAKWNKYSTESVSQGYEFMATPLQLCRAFCAYGNGGRIVTPHIIKGTLDDDGAVISQRPAAKLENCPQAIDPVTAADMKRILCDVVIRGTASKARDPVWNIFGKTGTSHISDGKNGYSLTRFNSSFMGGAPAENPRVVIAMIVHEPVKTIAHYGGFVAAPWAARALHRTMAYLQVPASPDLPLPPPNVANVLYAYDAKLYTDRNAKGKD